MKINLGVAAVVLGVVLACSTASAQTNGTGSGGSPKDQLQQRSQDQLQTGSPDLDQKRTRLRESLPADVQQAVQDMNKAREQYQRRLQDKKKELSASTQEERDRLREQLRAAIAEQAQDREQLRERLQALRETLPSHDQLMDQAREQVQQHDRRSQ